MNSFFEGNQVENVSLRCLGGSSPTLVNSIYPMKVLTELHYSHHIPGLTGRWMDTGAVALGGTVKGSFHRLSHGHHLFEDGFKVLINEKLSFGEFLHHLGMDFLTKRGIPNPLLPTALAEKLLGLGFGKGFVSELMTVNLPKVLSGSLGLICSGSDVYACFSNSIPHTFSSTGLHFLAGVSELAFGLYPPNIFLLTAGFAEFGVSTVSLYRTIVDPIIPMLGVPASVFLPALKRSVALSSIIGASAAVFSGSDWADTAKFSLAAATSSCVSTTVSLATAGKGFIAPFLGSFSGVASFFLAKKVLDFMFSQGKKEERLNYFEYKPESESIFSNEYTIPLVGASKAPIGKLLDNKLLLDEHAFSEQAQIWGCNIEK